MPKRGAELLVESLVSTGVKHLFTLSGNQIMSIYDATIGRDIELIHTRHEAAAVHMADGWGRMTERPGVALLTAGPGHCNAVSALYVALMAESPVVLLSGHCPISQIGKGAFQEIDQVATAEPVTKAAWLVTKANRLGEDIKAALSLACSGRPGPVHLSVPADVLEATVSTSPAAPDANRSTGDGATASSDISDNILNRLAEAERPLILAGPAMARPPRWKDVERLSAVTGIPALPMESPRGVNDPWLHQGPNCLAEADVVLLVGKKLDFSLRFGQPPFFAEACRFIQIDADHEQLREDAPVVLAIHAEPSHAVGQLMAAAQARRWHQSAWKSEVVAARSRVPSEWEQLCRSSQRPIHPLRVCHALQPFLDDGAVFISDGGEFGQWAQAGLEAECRLINGPSGAIGSSLPMGLAAKLAHPERQVFVILGDGTFGYHAMEFDTALRYNLPIIAIVGNDARWNAEHQLQIQNYGPDRTVGCDLLPSRYDKVVEALGGHGEFVQAPDDLTPALVRAMESGLPACVNVMIEGIGAPTFR
ncbi:MAG: thiamine pyrophosphate-binding protein [Candidatus Poribacteria bacterium]|nr:thiamine pyrophosphate-binding protein [Candidatus Poribacteria bacterium]